MPDQTVAELEQEFVDLNAQLHDLQTQLTPLEQVTQTNAAVDELRAMLQSTAEGAGDAKGEIDDYVEKLGQLDDEIKAYLESGAVNELTEGVGGGLEEFKDALEGVDEALGPLDEALDTIQNLLETSEQPADAQIEALAEAFEQAVDKLGPLIKRIPGLS